VTTPIFVVDAFTSARFAGNPAAVCLLDAPADEAWMQAVATEMRHSETAFVSPRDDGDHDLRWFTPTVEADLCGHATLATTHVLGETGRVAGSAEMRFHTRSGALGGRRTPDRRIEIDLPADPCTTADVPPALIEALGVTPVASARGRIGWLLELDDEAAVRAVRPDHAALARERASVVVTAPATTTTSGPAIDFVSRYFAPYWGIDEDPVTGAAHCALAPYWAERRQRRELVGYQASARGGIVGVRMGPTAERVLLTGETVTVLRGELAD